MTLELKNSEKRIKYGKLMSEVYIKLHGPQDSLYSTEGRKGHIYFNIKNQSKNILVTLYVSVHQEVL